MPSPALVRIPPRSLPASAIARAIMVVGLLAFSGCADDPDPDDLKLEVIVDEPGNDTRFLVSDPGGQCLQLGDDLRGSVNGEPLTVTSTGDDPDTQGCELAALHAYVALAGDLEVEVGSIRATFRDLPAPAEMDETTVVDAETCEGASECYVHWWRTPRD